MTSTLLDHSWVEVKPKAPLFQECDFYHTIKLPSGETVRGQWDLRSTVDSYLGHVDFRGKTVLEIGPASGFLSFHMERHGASVTAVEPSMARLWDCVPMPGIDAEAWRRSFQGSLERVRNSFWYLHSLYCSKARVIEADPEMLSPDFGVFDVGVFASVLLHCRSPFSVLEGCSRHVSKTIIVTDLHDVGLGSLPVCRLIPDVQHKQIDTWWALTPAFVVNALAVLGFGLAEVTTHHQRRDTDGQMVPLFTVVATRTEPMQSFDVQARSDRKDEAPSLPMTEVIKAAEIGRVPSPSMLYANTPSLTQLLSEGWAGPFAAPQRLGKPSGWWGHVPFAAWLVEVCRPDVLVELGVHHGVSYAAFCDAVERQGMLTRCFGVDHWRGDEHAGIYDDAVFQDIHAFNEQRYGAFSELIRAEFDEAVSRFENASVDILHIDGLHTYEAVAHDFLTWQPTLSDRAVVLFHDTNVHREDFGVRRLFREMSQQYPSFEFLHGNGLGVLAFGANAPEVIRQLCQKVDAAQASTIRTRFARLGAIWMGYAREQELVRSFREQCQTLESLRQAALRERDEALGKYESSLSGSHEDRAPLSSDVDEKARREMLLRVERRRDVAEGQVQLLNLRLEEARQVLASALQSATTGALAGASTLPLDELVAEVAQVLIAAPAVVSQLKEQAKSSEEELKRENTRLLQSLYDLQLDLTSQQDTHSQQLQAYGQVLGDLLRRHAEEVGFNASVLDGRERFGPSSLLGWIRQLLPASLPAILQSQRPLLHWLLTLINPVARVVGRSALFDGEWYLAAYPSVAPLRANPAYHYAVVGSRIGYDPGPWFSTARYLMLNPDVADAGINALYHYEIEGRKTGRKSGVRVGAGAANVQGLDTGRQLPVVVAGPFAPSTGMQTGVQAAVDHKQVFLAQARQQFERFMSDPGHFIDFPKVDQPVLSVIIVVFNQVELTFQCLKSIREVMDVPLEVILVDNASTDAIPQLLGKVRGCETLRQSENLHFLRGANVGAREARGRHLLFLNNDTVLRPGSLSAGSHLLDDEPSVGAVGGQILLLDGSLQEAGSIIWQDGSTQGYGRGGDPADSIFQFRRDVDYCSGAFLMVRRDVFERLGGFDPLFSPAYYEDADLCMRIWDLGQRVVYTPLIQITHVESASYDAHGESTRLIVNNRERFKRRHLERLTASHLRRSSGEFRARTHARTVNARVLLIDDNLPIVSFGSGFPRALEMLKGLCKKGVCVTHYTTSPADSGFPHQRGDLPDTVEYILGSREDLPAFLQERSGVYDMVVVSRPHNMKVVDSFLSRWPAVFENVSLVYDAEAIVSARDKLRHNLLAGKFAGAPPVTMDLSEEIALSRKADIVLAVSPSEAETFRRHGRQDVRVLGHRIVPTAQDKHFATRSNFLFVGRLKEMDSPNVDSIQWFLQEVMPLLDQQLGKNYAIDIVGMCAPELKRKFESARVRFHGRVEDLADFYARSRVFIAPTRFAAGLPLKVYEAAAHGVPVVATGILGRQLGWTDETDLFAAEDAAGFAHACARLYRDEAVWGRIREGALRRIRIDCDPALFQATLDQVLADILPKVSVQESSARTEHDVSRTRDEWSKTPDLRTQEQGLFWMAHPVVAERINHKTTGDRHVSAYPYLLSMLRARDWNFPVNRVASLGCGFGGLERELAALGAARRVDGFDLSEVALEQARRSASEAGMSNLFYQAVNLEHIELEASVYDMVLACHSVHHIDNLDRLFAQVSKALKPGGIFHLQEYVGPNRFQWTDAQLEVANQFNDALPSRYRMLPQGGERLTVTRPAAADVIAVDPSEAIRSSEIIDAVRRHFRVLDLRELGGGLLHNALCGIAQNFDPTREEDNDYLRALFDMEDRWMAEGRIQSDFVVITAIKD